MKHSFIPSGVCSRNITFEVRDGKVFNLHFEGGCPGNLKMISKLLDGFKIEDIISMCEGNLCGNKQTSCADQLAQGLKEISEEEKQPS